MDASNGSKSSTAPVKKTSFIGNISDLVGVKPKAENLGKIRKGSTFMVGDRKSKKNADDDFADFEYSAQNTSIPKKNQQVILQQESTPVPELKRRSTTSSITLSDEKSVERTEREDIMEAKLFAELNFAQVRVLSACKVSLASKKKSTSVRLVIARDRTGAYGLFVIGKRASSMLSFKKDIEYDKKLVK